MKYGINKIFNESEYKCMAFHLPSGYCGFLGKHTNYGTAHNDECDEKKMGTLKWDYSLSKGFSIFISGKRIKLKYDNIKAATLECSVVPLFNELYKKNVRSYTCRHLSLFASEAIPSMLLFNKLYC